MVYAIAVYIRIKIFTKKRLFFIWWNGFLLLNLNIDKSCLKLLNRM